MVWKASFLDVIWVIWKERSRRCRGVYSRVEKLQSSIKFCVVSWVPIVPAFRGISIDSMLRSWHDVAFSSNFKDQPLLSWFTFRVFFNLDFDGSVIGNPSPYGVDILFKIHHLLVFFVSLVHWASVC